MDPYARLRIILKLERRNGVPFAKAWERATARAAADQASPEAWLEGVRWAEDAWRRAYEGKPRQVIDWLEPVGTPEGFTPPRPAARVELLA